MLEKQLQQYFGFSLFKKGQKEIVSKMTAHQSAIAIFPTGAGKSLCYQLPALLLPHVTLVVSPLLSLMKDQIDFLRAHNIPAARLDSTLSKQEYIDILGEAKNGGLKILMISVERFKNERFRSHLKQMKISLLAVDEAHCISEWGHNFRPEYLKLPFYQQEFGIQQVLLLTATATPRVVDDMRKKFQVPRENVVLTGFYRKNLFLQVTSVNESRKNVHLLQRIRQDPNAPTIVYVTLQKTAEHVAGFLCSHNINASPYHAGMQSEARESVQNRFMDGGCHCIVATIAFGMGIDKKDIRRIIHYDLPKSIENYSQEIGRSGRDGNPSFCEVLANRDNINILENFIYGDTPEKQAIFKLLCMIQHSPDAIWELKPLSLSHELNIRFLPLKTLLVYLDMEGIIRPKYSHFGQYTLRYHIEPKNIVEKFKGERKEFVTAVFTHCHVKKTWTHIDIQGILDCYSNASRDRVVTALEYFEEKGWIELEARQAIETYDIVRKDFKIDETTQKLYQLFKNKEEQEVQKVHHMIDFFESSACISKQLAAYFGETIEKTRCGHCSFCSNGKTAIPQTTELKPLSTYNLEKITKEFIEIMGEQFSQLNLIKFLCGINTPVFVKRKIKNLRNFGILERYPFLTVKQWMKDEG